MLGAELTSRRQRSLAALAALALTAWATPFGVAPSVAAEQSVIAFQTITTEQLALMLQYKDFLFVNVHIPYEGEIAQSDAFIPFDQMSNHLDQLPTDKTAAIVLYCRSGRMSEIAASELAALGYSNVSHLGGGMIGWEESGYAVLHR